MKQKFDCGEFSCLQGNWLYFLFWRGFSLSNSMFDSVGKEFIGYWTCFGMVILLVFYEEIFVLDGINDSCELS